MKNTIRIPAKFYVDHAERSLPTPVDFGTSPRYALVKADDPALGELLSDAEHYAVPPCPDCSRGLISSAATTVRAIRNATGWGDAPPRVLALRKEVAR
jgi:hypothetical protein